MNTINIPLPRLFAAFVLAVVLLSGLHTRTNAQWVIRPAAPKHNTVPVLHPVPIASPVKPVAPPPTPVTGPVQPQSPTPIVRLFSYLQSATSRLLGSSR